jgi:hypothetical protein
MKCYANAIGLCAALLLAATSGACEINKAGKSDNFEFSYDTDDRLFPPSFNQPIAVGLSANVNVRLKDGGAPVTISSKSTANASVLTAPRASGSQLTLTGEGAGTTELTVRGGGLEDSVEVSVEAIKAVTLKYPGPFLQSVAGPVAAVVNADVPFPMTMMGTAGHSLIGYGVVPVTVDPATAGAQVATEDVAHVTLHFVELGPVKLRPVETTPLDVTVIAAADVANLSLEGLFNVVSVGVALDSTGFVAVKASTADAVPVVGLTQLADVISDTPATCSVASRINLGDGTFAITPLAEGACRILATYGALSAQIEVPIRPAS